MNIAKAGTIAAILAALALALAGCGGTSTPSRHYTEQQVLHALRVQSSTDSIGVTSWQDPATGCSVIVALTTPAAVSLYAGAGDPVASNPAHTAGVKFASTDGMDSDSACQRLFTGRLAALK